MDNLHKTKLLLKILVGVAWIDGLIQPEEREYLRQMADNQGIAEDPEIKSLLSEIKSVSPAECYRWLEEYLGENHNEKDYQDLLESLSALIYSDGNVQIQEAQLLSKLQLLDPATEPHRSIFDKLLANIQKLYRKAVNENIS